MASSSSLVSGPIKDLAANPLDFLKKYPIVFEPALLPPEYKDGETFRSGTAGVKLVQSTTANHYNLQFVAIKDLETHKEAMKAFVLGFKSNKGNDDVQFVDVPNAPYQEGTFIFTVGLTGCSVVVTRLDRDKYRVFHDRRMDSAVLYDNVEMCVNFNDYRIGGHYLSHTGKAFTCMQYQKLGWKMFLQRQPPGWEKVPASGPKCEAYAVEKKGPLSPESLEKVFNDRRAIIQNRLKSSAKKLKVDKNLIDGAKDGVVRGKEFDKDAIRGWEALRKAIKDQIKKDEEKGIDRPLKDTYEGFKYNVDDSEDIDETWVWLQVKKNKAKPKDKAKP